MTALFNEPEPNTMRRFVCQFRNHSPLHTADKMLYFVLFKSVAYEIKMPSIDTVKFPALKTSIKFIYLYLHFHHIVHSDGQLVNIEIDNTYKFRSGTFLSAGYLSASTCTRFFYLRQNTVFSS